MHLAGGSPPPKRNRIQTTRVCATMLGWALGSCRCADTRPFEMFARRFQLMLCHKIRQGRLQPPTPQPLARQWTSAARLGSCTPPLPAGEPCDSLVPPASPAVLAPTGFRPLHRFIFPFLLLTRQSRASLPWELLVGSDVPHLFPSAAIAHAFGHTPQSIFLHVAAVPRLPPDCWRPPVPGEMPSHQPGHGASQGPARSCRDPGGKK